MFRKWHDPKGHNPLNEIIYSLALFNIPRTMQELPGRRQHTYKVSGVNTQSICSWGISQSRWDTIQRASWTAMEGMNCINKITKKGTTAQEAHHLSAASGCFISTKEKKVNIGMWWTQNYKTTNANNVPWGDIRCSLRDAQRDRITITAQGLINGERTTTQIHIIMIYRKWPQHNQ